MPTDTFTALGTVDHGRLTLRDPETFREAMRHVPDGEVAVSVGEATPRRRTLAQNSFYWVLCEALATDTGLPAATVGGSLQMLCLRLITSCQFRKAGATTR